MKKSIHFSIAFTMTALGLFMTMALAQPVDLDKLSELMSNPGEAKDLASTLNMVYGESFSWPMIIGNLVFSTIGFFAFIHGWKHKNWKPLWIGIGLSAFPWFVSNVFVFYALGLGLCLCLYYFSDRR
jgi:hypothetical protein